jgi:Zn-dependent protease
MPHRKAIKAYPSIAPAMMFNIEKREAADILISVFAISLALSIYSGYAEPLAFASMMAVFTVTIGAGFVLHELMHKLIANSFGAQASFQAWHMGLLLMVGLALLSLAPGMGGIPLFLAPGAVYIYARSLTVTENGIISIAGPLTNIAVALFFFMAGILFYSVPWLGTVSYLGAYANFFLAFFNLLPLYPLDGSKVIRWSWPAWLLATVFSLAGLLLLGFKLSSLLGLLLVVVAFSLFFRSFRG